MIRLRTKFSIAVAGLLVIVIFLGIVNIRSNYHTIAFYQHLDKRIELSHRATLVLYELQKERGVTIGFLTDHGHFTAKDLHGQRKKTDQFIQKQKIFFDQNAMRYFPNIKTKAIENFKRIASVRHEVDHAKTSLEDILRHYTEINTFLLETIADFATEASIPSITKNMLAYSHFLFLLDYVGLERAGGIIFLSKGMRTLRNLSQASAILALKQEHKRLFLHYANQKTKDVFLPILNSPTTQKIRSIEKATLYPVYAHQEITPKAWYRLMTQKIDQLNDINRLVEKQIVMAIRDQIKQSQQKFGLGIALIVLSLAALVVMVVVFLRLYRTEQQQRTILDKHVIGSTTDTQGIITDVSQAFCDISGYTRRELVGQRLDFVCHSDTHPEHFGQFWDEVSSGKPWQGKFKNQKKDGTAYWVYIHIEPLRDAIGKISGYFAMRIDITEQEELRIAVQEKEEESRKQKVIMEQQNRLAQMGEMIGMIAHQWRQPLGAIAAISGSMRVKASLGNFDPEAALDHAAKIEKLTQHMSQTVDDFRNYFKPSQEKEVTNYQKIVEDVLIMISDSLQEQGIKLILDTQNTPPLLTYQSKLKQVVINLIKNAKDVLVERQIESPSIHITAKENRLCVTDNAGGISDEILPYIFDPYFSTKGQQDGTGLGLYMSKMIIEEHCKGTLTVESREGKTRFCITLPKERIDEAAT